MASVKIGFYQLIQTLANHPETVHLISIVYAMRVWCILVQNDFILKK